MQPDFDYGSRIFVNVVALVVPVRTASHESAGRCSIEYLEVAAHAWQLQLELVWSYLRLCDVLWSRPMTLDR